MLITFYSHFTSNLMSLIDCQVVSSFSYRLTQSLAVTLWFFFTPLSYLDRAITKEFVVP